VDAGCAFDEMRLARGRRSRVVLTPRRWRQVGERNFTDDGGKQARSPGRARRKPLKPSRAGMPGDPGATVVTNACAHYTLRTRLRVHRAPGIPHALCWAKVSGNNSDASRRGKAELCLVVIASEAKQSIKPQSENGLLRRFAPRKDDLTGRGGSATKPPILYLAD
jgi:hypothetical protein